MTKMPSNSEDQLDWIAELSRFLVAIRYCFVKGESRETLIITAFSMQIINRWYLMTAAHWYSENDDNEPSVNNFLKAGYQVETCQVIDNLSNRGPHDHPITLGYDPDAPLILKKGSADYCAHQIWPNHCRAMKANGGLAITEDLWGADPQNVTSYCLLGIPEELTDVTLDGGIVPVVQIPVEPLEQKPPVFKESNGYMFYGRVLIDDYLDSIGGMSGGPILAFGSENGKTRFWLIGIQSSWNRSTREIAGCRIGYFARALERKIKTDLPHDWDK